MCLGAGVSAFGHGANPVALDLSDGGAWLVSDPTGTLVHVNGPSGRADAAVPLPGAAGHDLAVAVAAGGKEVLVTDRDAGTVHRVDPARLEAVRSAAFDREVTIVVGGGDVYAVESGPGRIRRLDPLRLSTVGAVIRLPAGLGAAGQTGDGTLWVPVPAEGTVVPVRAGVPGAPVPVTPAGHQTAVTVVDDRPVVVDRTGRTVTPLTAGAAGRPVALPRPIAVRGNPGLLVPARADGDLLPLVEPAGRLVLVDLRAGGAWEVGVPTAGGGNGGNGGSGGNGGRPAGRRLGAPTSHAGHVYVPDSDAGVVWDFDPAGRRFAAPVPVGPAGGPARVTVTVQDGQLWVNDATGANVVLVTDRTRRTIIKRASNLPGVSGGTPRPLPPAPTSGPADGALGSVPAQPDQPGPNDHPDDRGRSGDQPPRRPPGHRGDDLPPRDGRPKPGGRPTTATLPPPTVVPSPPAETPTAQPTTVPPVPTASPGDG
jgi:hypothetical protein